MVNRVVMNTDNQGCFTIFSDEPIEFFVVNDQCPGDRVYQMDVDVGVEKVRAELRDDPIGHKHDDHAFGAGYGPRKPASRRKFEVVK